MIFEKEWMMVGGEVGEQIEQVVQDVVYYVTDDGRG